MRQSIKKHMDDKDLVRAVQNLDAHESSVFFDYFIKWIDGLLEHDTGRDFSTTDTNATMYLKGRRDAFDTVLGVVRSAKDQKRF